MGFLEDQEFWAWSQCFSGTDFSTSVSQKKPVLVQTDSEVWQVHVQSLTGSLTHHSSILAMVVYLKQDLQG